jgi:DNA gyrase subunit B
MTRFGAPFTARAIEFEFATDTRRILSPIESPNDLNHDWPEPRLDRQTAPPAGWVDPLRKFWKMSEKQDPNESSESSSEPSTNPEMSVYGRVEGDYGADQLKHLSDLEHVRERPSMYIGDTTKRGLHHLVYEVVDNSIDEAMAGYAQNVFVTINGDSSVTVQDDGRGIPVEMHADLGFSTLQGVMTVLKFGGKFEKGAYQVSGGLHGVGVTVVNFVSEWCEVEVAREGHIYKQE